VARRDKAAAQKVVDVSVSQPGAQAAGWDFSFTSTVPVHRRPRVLTDTRHPAGQYGHAVRPPGTCWSGAGDGGGSSPLEDCRPGTFLVVIIPSPVIRVRPWLSDIGRPSSRAKARHGIDLIRLVGEQSRGRLERR